ncbi:DNA-binding MarR family transcriptional regulator [Herbihabitans rhizosphaerae]|uniref:DNA-binding MarR family transcriptional regulator n=1 Tax=Herbihabitans rhizosphaerae TaxID=1872711 RepID=A0A4Q7KIT7_9PSEU|nr:MarR family transcriptional regulator [Herbihabitans rhizosphaerae]RZS36325.1 DNA-binding MarR family transcriptional regulator [Herbihabitans rhizosphaerae]
MATTAPVSLETDLLFLLSWAGHALATEQTVALADVGITPRAHCVLYKAVEGDGLTQTRLAQVCGLDKTTMVATVDELERKGLARREPAPEDRRARIIVVTPEGAEVLARATRIVARIQADVLEHLPEDLRRSVVEGLTRLVDGRLASPAVCDRPPRRRG